MSEAPYIVSVVLDPEFGERIGELLETGPVWVLDSPANRDSAQKIWLKSPYPDQLTGVTVFKGSGDHNPAQMLINELETIDLHHGVYSTTHPFTVIRIVGCGLCPEVKKEFEKFGFETFTPTAEGFEATA